MNNLSNIIQGINESEDSGRFEMRDLILSELRPQKNTLFWKNKLKILLFYQNYIESESHSVNIINLEKLNRKRFLKNWRAFLQIFLFTNSNSVCSSEWRLKIKLSCLQRDKSD